MQAKLVVVNGRATKQEVAVRLPFAIGRSDASNLTIEHRAISRQHCELLERNGRLVVRDVGSANGTYVGDRQISGEAVLEPGDTFTVGPLTFRAVYEVAAAPAAPVAESPAAGATLIEEDAATPATNPLSLPHEESELDSFDLELSDDIDLPEIARGDFAEPLAAAAPDRAAAAEEAELDDSLDDLRLDDKLEDDLDVAALSLPLDLDEPPASDVPVDLADSLDLDLAETVTSSFKSDESLELDLDLGLDDELVREASRSAPQVEEDDSPTEIGEYVDLRDDDADAAAETPSAVPAESQELSEVPENLLAELDGLEASSTNESAADALTARVDESEAASVPASTDGVRDYSDLSHVDDAPSQELFLIDGEESAAPATASKELDDAETPWADLDDELAATSLEPESEVTAESMAESTTEPSLAPAAEALDEEELALDLDLDLALAEPLVESELDVESDLFVEQEPVVESELDHESELVVEQELIVETEPVAESAPVAESTSDLELPDLVSTDEEALALDEPLAEATAADAAAISLEDTPVAEEPIAPAPTADEELLLDLDDDLPLATEPSAPLAAEPVSASAEPDFTSWMYEEPLAESAAAAVGPLASDDDLPGLDAPQDEPADSLALDDELPPLDLEADALPLLELNEAEDELSFEPIAEIDESIGEPTGSAEVLESPSVPADEESSLDEFHLEDSVAESAEIELADFDVEDSAPSVEAGPLFDDQPLATIDAPELDLPPIEATTEPLADEMISLDEISFDDEIEEVAAMPADEESIAELPLEGAVEPVAESLAAPEANDEVDFDDWVASELTTRPATPVEEQVSLDEPSFPALEEAPAPVAAEADDELNFDDMPGFESEAKVKDDFQLDDELNFDEVDAPTGSHEKVELPAVFEESASLDLDAADAGAAMTPVELPPTEPPKAKRSWWPFGRKREPKPPKPPKAPKTSKGKKKENQTLDAPASFPLEELPLEDVPLAAAAIAPDPLSDEIEFSLDDGPDFSADEPSFEASATGSVDLFESPPREPQHFAPADPLDELNFPLDDGGASMSKSELAFNEATFEEAEFDEPRRAEPKFAAAELDELSLDEPNGAAEPVVTEESMVEEPVADELFFDEPAPAVHKETAEAEVEFASEESASSEFEAFSLDEEEPAVAFEEGEPEISYDDIEATSPAVEEAPLEFDEVSPLESVAEPLFEDELPAAPSAQEKPESIAPAAPEQAAEKSRRRWWPFGGKKKDASAAAAPDEPQRNRADKKESRGTLLPDDLSAADLIVEPSFVEETDSERIARRLASELPSAEPYPGFEDDVVGSAQQATYPSPSVAAHDDADAPSFEMNEAEAPEFSLDEDADAPSFEMEEELPEFVDDSDATTTANKTRSAGSEGPSNDPDAWSDRTPRSEPRSQRRSPQDPEDDWDNFLQSFDS